MNIKEVIFIIAESGLKLYVYFLIMDQAKS